MTTEGLQITHRTIQPVMIDRLSGDSETVLILFVVSDHFHYTATRSMYTMEQRI